MSDVSTAMADAAQNAIFATSTNYYLSLHTGDPAATGANEGSEGRQAIQFGASSTGTQASTTAQVWASAVGGTYPYFGIWSAASSGTYKRGGALTSTISPPAAASITFAIGAITLTAS
jgi:hypothetical protein